MFDFYELYLARSSLLFQTFSCEDTKMSNPLLCSILLSNLQPLFFTEASFLLVAFGF